MGVNVTKSALHVADGELLSAQNGVPDPRGLFGALTKRDGLSPITGVALSGAIQGIINMPYPFVQTLTLYAGIDTGSSVLWRTSTNGTVWASQSVTPTRPQRASDNSTTANNSNAVAVTHKGVLYYAGDDYIVYPTASFSKPTIHRWDGVTDTIVAYAPSSFAIGAGTAAQAILGMCLHNNKIYFSTLDGGAVPTLNSRVFEYDPASGQVQQIGQSAAVAATEFSGGMVWALASHNGFLWAGTSYGNGGGQRGQLFYIRPGIDTTWTAHNAAGLAANYQVMSLLSWNGALYVGTRVDTVGSPVRLYKVSSLNVYTVSDSGQNTSAGYSHYSGLTAFGTNLFALLYDDGVGAAQNRILVRKFDGTSWSTVYTLGTLGAGRTQHLLGMGLVPSDSSAIYLLIAETDAGGGVDPNSDGIILRSTNGTTFTEVDQITNVRGVIGYTLT